MYLRVEALLCPALLPRLLAMLTRRAVAPVDVQLDRDDKWQQIEIILDGLRGDTQRKLLASLGAIQEIRSAELTDIAGRPLIASGKSGSLQGSVASAVRRRDFAGLRTSGW
ncbi:hypothetical protein [Sphingopyxis sp.]|uniref:hypothetical protein n=1 Tax=Sphingopyxis sp. TaxID=1908224 RepID=UPI002B4A54A9|nr:hypothetical protein [Sphingopyxis sp.]HJS12195.1 hypothetical protein [Sphingopyxis sp.]